MTHRSQTAVLARYLVGAAGGRRGMPRKRLSLSRPWASREKRGGCRARLCLPELFSASPVDRFRAGARPTTSPWGIAVGHKNQQ